jgi:signal peptidase II
MTIRKRLRVFLLLVLIATTVGCDRVTKHLAITSLAGMPGRSFLANTVRLEYAENSGGFLSIGSSLSDPFRIAIFIVATVVILIGLPAVTFKYLRSGWDVVAISLAFAGGASNLLDRITHGTVIDFVSVGLGSLRTGIFNVADVAILAGILMLLVSRPSGIKSA